MNEYISSSASSTDSQNFFSQENYYQILDVSHSASRLEIREAYIRLKNTYASTSQVLYSLFSEEDARANLKALEEAYRVLDDDVLRREYDARLFNFNSRRSGNLAVCDVVDDGVFEQGVASCAVFDSGAESAAGVVGAESMAWSGLGASELTGSSKPLPSARSKRFAAYVEKENIQEEMLTVLNERQESSGRILVKLREIAGVSHEGVQETTKISLQYIIGLENDDFKNLPAIVYVKGFLKSYLEFLGIEKQAEAYVNEYLENLKHWREHN